MQQHAISSDLSPDKNVTPRDAVCAPVDFVPDDQYFRRPRSPFGGSALSLSIGPIRITLDGLSARQASWMSDRHAPFVSAPVSTPHVSINLQRAGVDAFLKLPTSGTSEFYRMGRRTSGRRYFFWSYEFAGWIDSSSRRAQLALVREEGPIFERGLENFLRVITATFILDHGGFLLHGAGVVRVDRAYVFFGPSGVGKTTVTRFSPGDVILSDDLTLVVPRDGVFEATGIPFGMAHHRVPDTRESFPIVSMNRLVQSDDVRQERIRGARALGEVGSCLPFVMQDPKQAAKALQVVGEALRSLPVFRLHFRRDDQFWSVVQER